MYKEIMLNNGSNQQLDFMYVLFVNKKKRQGAEVSLPVHRIDVLHTHIPDYYFKRGKSAIQWLDMVCRVHKRSQAL
jgi:hypothetical protein